MASTLGDNQITASSVHTDILQINQTFKPNVAMTTNNVVDLNANQLNSGGGKIAASANGAINHNYGGTLTPTLINTMLTVAGTVIWGTIGNTQATITMSVAGAFVAQAMLV